DTSIYAYSIRTSAMTTICRNSSIASLYGRAREWLTRGTQPLRLAHADEAAVVFPRQRPQKRADFRALEEEADSIDAHTRPAGDGAVPVLLHQPADVLGQQVGALCFLQVIFLLRSQSRTDFRQA